MHPYENELDLLQKEVGVEGVNRGFNYWVKNFCYLLILSCYLDFNLSLMI